MVNKKCEIVGPISYYLQVFWHKHGSMQQYLKKTLVYKNQLSVKIALKCVKSRSGALLGVKMRYFYFFYFCIFLPWTDFYSGKHGKLVATHGGGIPKPSKRTLSQRSPVKATGLQWCIKFGPTKQIYKAINRELFHNWSYLFPNFISTLCWICETTCLVRHIL